MAALRASYLGAFRLTVWITACGAHASEPQIVTAPELNVFRRPTVYAERIATWRKNDEVVVDRQHTDDEGHLWVFACKGPGCGWVDQQFLARRASEPTGTTESGPGPKPDGPREGAAQQPTRVKVEWRRIAISVRLGGPAGGKAVLGAHLLNRTGGMAVLEPPDVPGAAVWALSNEGAAETAGLRMFDVITLFDGKPVLDASGLVALVRATVPGTKVEVSVLRPDIDAAIRHYRPQCEADQAPACSDLSLLYMSKREWETAYQWADKAARMGSVAAMLNVANMHQTGTGASKSRADAARWYVAAAEKGSKLAIERLRAMGIEYKAPIAGSDGSAGSPVGILEPLERLE